MRRIDGVMVVAVLASLGAVLVEHPVSTSFVTVTGLLIIIGRVSRTALSLGAMLFVLNAARGYHAVHDAAVQRGRLKSILSGRQRCELDVALVTSPIMRTAGTRARRGRFSGVFEVSTITCGRFVADGPFRARIYGLPPGIGRGDELRILVDGGLVRAFENPGSENPLIRIARGGGIMSGSYVVGEVRRRGHGITRSVDRLREHVRRRILATYPSATAAMARALVLGETDLSAGDREAFMRSGLMHLLAVSGTHLVLAVLVAASVVEALLTRVIWISSRYDVRRICAPMVAVGAWFYADFAGGGGSAYRAATMMTVVMIARWLGRPPDPLRALALSLLAGTIWTPWVLFDLSFALSLLATTGLMLGNGWVSRVAASGGRIWGVGVRLTGATLAATCACTPLLLMVSPGIPLLGVVANVVAAPFGELAALPVCLTHALLWWSPDAEAGAAAIGSGALSVVLAVAKAASADRFATLALAEPTPLHFALSLPPTLYLAVTARFRSRCATFWATMSIVLGLAGAEACVRLRPLGRLTVTAMDVAQGDAILVELPNAAVMLVDGGGLVGSPLDVGKRVLLAQLRRRRIKHLEVMVLTHPHPDHYLGLRAVADAVSVGELWVNGQALASDEGSALRRWIKGLEAKGTRVLTPADLCGPARRFGEAAARVLGPCPNFDASRSANDNSLVLRLSLGTHVAILSGDAERAQEAALVKRWGQQLLRADLLKVGHHGSRTSTTTPWLEATRPRHALVSCGIRNRFGHPHAVTLDRLSRMAARVYRTDWHGASSWSTDGVTQSVTLGRDVHQNALIRNLEAALQW